MWGKKCLYLNFVTRNGNAPTGTTELVECKWFYMESPQGSIASVSCQSRVIAILSSFCLDIRCKVHWKKLWSREVNRGILLMSLTG